MRKDRKVYLVMGYAHGTHTTYVSEVCSSRKKAEAHKNYITEVMDKHSSELHTYWVYDARVN